MKYIGKHKGFITIGVLSVITSVALIAMVGLVTGLALMLGGGLGVIISNALSGVRGRSSGAVDMRES